MKRENINHDITLSCYHNSECMNHLCFIYAPLNINNYSALFTYGSVNMGVYPARSSDFSVPNIDPTVVRGYITGSCGLFSIEVELDLFLLY